MTTDAERDTDVGPRTDPSPDAVRGASQVLSSEALPTPTPSTIPTESVTRPAPSSESQPGTDTLLSVPASATREDLALDQRLADVERKLSEVEFRLSSLENRAKAPSAAPDKSWAPWLIFLAVLAVAWQILAFFR
ncbi:MAG: hypothetical protein M3020_08800 [Myxococcota bacterium]|jgi:hypothetical protein|nr:hypothetical protein [Myxococcota bacterium]